MLELASHAIRILKEAADNAGRPGARAGPIIAFMSPVVFTPERQCYTVLFW
jgi:hypothetical protein